jgi:hypothetical protein
MVWPTSDPIESSQPPDKLHVLLAVDNDHDRCKRAVMNKRPYSAVDRKVFWLCARPASERLTANWEW